MNTILHVVVVVIIFWLVFVRSGPTSPPAAPDTRELVMARVLLHLTRRRRQLAELERVIKESARRRLSELEHEDWGRPT